MEFIEELLYMFWSFNRDISLRTIISYVVTAVVAYLVYIMVIRPWLSPLSKVPGQWIYVPFLSERRFFRDLLCGDALHPTDRPLTRYRVGTNDALLVKGTDVIKHVLMSRKYRRTIGQKRSFQSTVGHSLLAVSGEEHTQMRKILSPSFKGSAIQDMLPIFQVYAKGLRDLWKVKVEMEGKEGIADICIQDNLNSLTLDVISDAAFGYRLNSIQNGNNELSSAFMIAFGAQPSRTIRNLLPYVNKFPTEEKAKAEQAIEKVRGIVKSIVDIKMKGNQKRRREEMKPTNLLESMLEYSWRHGLTSDDLVDHVRTMMFAGHETTSTSLMWTLYCLARNPEVQKKAREEVRAVMTGNDVILTPNHIEAMPYITAVVKEGLRLSSTIPGLVKICTEDDQIGPYQIPAGTRMGLSFVGVHRNPKYWRAPEKFDPSRFLEPRCNDISPWQYLPFSAGKHTCIGYRLSLLESKVTLAVLLRDLEFSEVPGFTFKKKTTIALKADPPMRLKIRQVRD